jgi:hypothetical protein
LILFSYYSDAILFEGPGNRTSREYMPEGFGAMARTAVARIGHKKTLEPLYLIDFDFRPDCNRQPLIAASGASY